MAFGGLIKAAIYQITGGVMLKKIVVGALAVIMLFLVGAYGAYKFFYPGSKIDSKRPVEIAGEDKFVAAGRTNIAVMGVDERSDDDGRTDTLFVIMYDPKNEKISMLSIPRDTRVRIPKHGFDKINHAYNYGGAASTVRTLENFLGIRIDYYVKVDFKGFERMVDAIDGVEIDVEKRMYYEDPWDGDDGFIIDLKPGRQTLNGKQAIQYVRYRDEEGDIGRITRQQKFINAVYDKMSSPSMLIKIPSLVKVAMESVTTDMGATDMLQIGKTFQKNSKAGLKKLSVPGEAIFIDEINYWLPDIVALRSEIAEILGLDANSQFMDSARTLAQAYRESLPSDAGRDGIIGTDEDKDGNKKDTGEADKDKTGKKDAETGNKTTDPKKATDGKDKPAGKPVTDKPPAKPGQGSDTSSDSKVPRVVRASVINCSGDPEGGKKMERLLERSGISVVSIFSGNPQQASSIISNTHDGWVVSKLSALPFRYSLRIDKSSEGRVEAVVYVGQDFVKNN